MDNRGLEKLDQWLLKYGNDDSILSASELDGYFAAIVSGPRQVAPAIWYSAIWADQPPQWPSDKDGERFMKLAVELMSEAAYMLAEEPDDYEAIFLADNNGKGEKLIVSEWCAGYLRGAAVAGWLEQALPESAQAALALITLHGDESGSETLKGWGLAANYTRPGDWFARLDYARRIGDSKYLSEDAKSKGRVWFLLGKIW